VLPLSDALMVTTRVSFTVLAVAMKLAVVELAATLAEYGIWSDVLSSDIFTNEPPDGAAFDNITLQVVLPPDATVDGVHCSAVTVTVATGVTVTDAVAEVPFNVAVSITACVTG
jgi:hypothetical protein